MNKCVDREVLKEGLLNNLRKARLNNGLYIAAEGTNEEYSACWIRDCIFVAMAELHHNKEYYRQTIHTLLDYFHYHENKHQKLHHLILDPSVAGREWRFIHPRFNPYTFEEYSQEWRWSQIDTYGELLYALWLGRENDIKCIRNEADRELIQKIITMLMRIDYTTHKTASLWEENMEIKSSSLGAVLSGLTCARMMGFEVNQYWLDKAHYQLNSILPREDITRETDLALMTLIYPYNIVSPDVGRQILHDIETKLTRSHGVIRYIGDNFYFRDNCEGEWSFGFTYLALCWHTYGEYDKAKYYLDLAIERTVQDDFTIPEMFIGNNKVANDNKCLAWSLSMMIQCLAII